MTSSNDRNDSHRTASGEPNLARRTLRTVGILVAACVVFVGVLSVLAVSITSRAVKPGGSGAPVTSERGATDTNENAKKPLSI